MDLHFPALLAMLRKQLGIGVNTAANFCNISRYKYQRLERGKIRKVPKDNRLEKLAELYDLPVQLLRSKLEEYIKMEKRDARSKRDIPAPSRDWRPGRGDSTTLP